MNLCDVILLNFLASMCVFFSINAGETSTNFGSIKENYTKLANISRAKRSGSIMSLCSSIMRIKKMESGLPCAISSEYELRKIIAAGGCGTVLEGKIQSISMVSQNIVFLFLSFGLSSFS